MSASNQDASLFSSPLATKRSPRAASQLRIRELRTWEGLPELKNAWNELLAGSTAPAVSPTWESMRSWWASQERGHELKLLFCSGPGGEVAAILPMMRNREQILPGISALVLRLIGDGFAGFENLDWIARRGSAPAVVREVLDWLERNALEWDILALNTVPASSPVATELREQMAEREWRVIETESCNPILSPLPGARMACARPFSKGACALVMAQHAERVKDWLRAHIFAGLPQSYRRLRRAKPLPSSPLEAPLKAMSYASRVSQADRPHPSRSSVPGQTPSASTQATPELGPQNEAEESPLRVGVEAKRGWVELVEQLALEWRFLSQESSADEPFFQPEWIAAYTRAYLSPGKLLLLTARTGEKLSAVLPLIDRRATVAGIPVRRLRGAYRPYTSRFDLTRRDGPEGDLAVNALWTFLKELPDWDLLEFPDVPQGGALEDLLRLAEADGFPIGRERSMNSPYLSLSGWDGSQDYFLRKVNPRFASTLRRRKRKLAEQGPLVLRSSRDADPDLLRRFFDLEASGWKGRRGTAIRDDDRHRRFYEEVARGAARFGHFQLYFLEHHGKTIAGHIGFSYRRRHSTPKGAHSEEYNRYGPGHLMIDAVLRDCAEQGLTEFDFLCEDDPWKLSWTSQVRPHSNLYIFRQSRRGRLAHLAKFKFKPALRELLGKRKPAQ